MVFVGQLNDTKALAAVGLSICFKNVIADSWMFGMNTGLETLASQAVGAGNYRRAGEYLHRGRAVLLVLFIPITFLMLSSEYILINLFL